MTAAGFLTPLWILAGSEAPPPAPEPLTQALRDGAGWLARHQHPCGAWMLVFRECGKPPCKTEKSAGSPIPNDTALTAYALQALLGLPPELRKERDGAIGRGLAWLMKQQTPEGLIGKRNAVRPLYNHVVTTATLALAVQAGRKEKGLKACAQKAVDYLVGAHNPGAGWRYCDYGAGGLDEEDGNNDTHITSLAVLALHHAQEAGLRVEGRELLHRDAGAWLDSVLQEGTYGYTRKFAFLKKQPQTSTALGVLARRLMEQERGVAQGSGILLERLPDPQHPSFYCWRYSTLALRLLGGEPWATWRQVLEPALLDLQERDGCVAGSWDASEDPWGDEGGRAYTTAMALLCLEAFQHAP